MKNHGRMVNWLRGAAASRNERTQPLISEQISQSNLRSNWRDTNIIATEVAASMIPVEDHWFQRHSILGAVALHVAEEFKNPLSERHYDPTHVLFEGAYNTAAKREGVVSDDGVRTNDVLSVAAYVPSEHSPGRSSSGKENDCGEDSAYV